VSDHLIDEIADDLNGNGPSNEPDMGGIWVFLIAIAVGLLWRFA